MRPRLLDLFCGAGGAALGYDKAGFDVIGIDIAPQPAYPFRFIQADALLVPASFISGFFAAVHASPPCQAFTKYRNHGSVGDYPDLIAETRSLLEQSGLPYVIENVVGAPLHDPTLLCGSMFDLDIQRHRLFETNWPLETAQPCRHMIWGRNRFPGGRSMQRTGSSRGLVRSTIEIGSWDIPLLEQQRAMGIDRITLEELSEAIPPAYTELIGHQLLAYLRVAA